MKRRRCGCVFCRKVPFPVEAGSRVGPYFLHLYVTVEVGGEMVKVAGVGKRM